jgi:hypothetical protein
MPESLEQTSLTKIADNLVSSIFDGGVSSNEVITPEESIVEPVKEPEIFSPEHNVIVSPEVDLTTSELIGDIIKPVKKPKESTSSDEEVEEDAGPEPIAEDSPFSFLNDLYKENIIVPFEDEEAISSVKDLKELIKANIEEAKQKAKEEALKEEVESLPDAVKVLVEYAKNGGTDFGTIFSYLSRSEQTQEFDIDTEDGQINVIRQYYEDTGWDADDIDTQINILKDAGGERLRTVAARFKDKVDELNNARLEQHLEEQRKLQAQAQEMRQNYIQNLTSTLKKGTIGGLKLTREEQKDLYSGLVEERYPTHNGMTTNRLGALLNKIQFQEPNFELLAEVQLLLTNREEYHKKIRDAVTAEVTSNQVRKIKSEQGLKASGSEIQQTKKSGLRRLGSISNPFK